ncbi:alpha/beta hydrolase [Hymenobacter lutimineralis]|uniref:Alpha/beta hydrolase n=1 Tax=Hymenobacter lutimineralis TaxID=2606448 RepID=A0A5D6UUD6_9BACT|nr:alpha/beta hydrolase [Hymenobacter lutimineralis]TYZ06262.1 alpha/beta hydrolase [Hymenobacter lutimineralis]
MAFPLEHHDIRTNGVTLHVAQCGPANGPLVVLLHGFPEFWYSWRHQIMELAAAGYRVWVPDQRGYNRSEKPAGISAYQLKQLGADVLGLLDAAGVAQAAVVGHDWGGIVAWWLAVWHPERISRAAILNVPHPAVLGQAARKVPRQLLKSWYVFFFQLPWLPEWLFRRRQFRFGRGVLRGTSRAGTFSSEDLVRYVAAWNQPGALTSMINWYRAGLCQPSRTGRVSIPLLLLWGKQDAFLEPRLAAFSLQQCAQGQLVYFEQATHWLHQEEPAAVNRHLLDFLRLGLPVSFPI